MLFLKYVNICLCGDDSRDVKCVSALCDSGAEICVVNSFVVEGLNFDFIGQIQLRPFCGNTVTADLVCLNVSLVDSDVPSITPNHVVKVTSAVVPDLHGKFILSADVIDRLSRCKINTSITVSQAQVNDDVNSPVVIDSGNNINKGVMNLSPLTLPQTHDDVTTDEVLTTDEENVICHDDDVDFNDITDGGVYPHLIVVCYPRLSWPRNSVISRHYLVVGSWLIRVALAFWYRVIYCIIT